MGLLNLFKKKVKKHPKPFVSESLPQTISRNSPKISVDDIPENCYVPPGQIFNYPNLWICRCGHTNNVSLPHCANKSCYKILEDIEIEREEIKSAARLFEKIKSEQQLGRDFLALGVNSPKITEEAPEGSFIVFLEKENEYFKNLQSKKFEERPITLIFPKRPRQAQEEIDPTKLNDPADYSTWNLEMRVRVMKNQLSSLEFSLGKLEAIRLKVQELKSRALEISKIESQQEKLRELNLFASSLESSVSSARSALENDQTNLKRILKFNDSK